MISKFLEKKVEITLNDDLEQLKNPINLEYYLLESDEHDMEEVNVEKVFGVEIVKKVNGCSDEIETVKNLSCCRENARDILEKLARNTVTPVGLPYILDELLGA